MTRVQGGEDVYRVRKVINNSVILAHDSHGRDCVFLGKGIGFGRHPGDVVDLENVERRFAASSPPGGIQIGAYLYSIPPEDIALAARVVELAGRALSPSIGERAILPLADHLSVVIRRTQQGSPIEYPVRWEIESIYPREVQFARTVIEYIASERGVVLPEGEAPAIALHFVNAELGSGEMGPTMEVTTLINDALEVLSSYLGTPVDRGSLEVLRFITHLRFLIVRKFDNEQVAPIAPAVRTALLHSNPQALAVADDIARQITTHFNWTIADDEVVYIALHAASVIHAGTRNKRSTKED